MRDKLNKSFEQLELFQDELIKRLEGYNDEQLNFRPIKGGWSILQILFHLMQYESMSISYIQHKLLTPNRLERSGIKAMMRSMLLDIVFFLPLQLKAPKVLMAPTHKLKFIEVYQSWNNTRVNLKKTIERIPPDLLGKNIFRHPLAGMLNMQQALHFMKVHLKHHRRKIKSMERKLQQL